MDDSQVIEVEAKPRVYSAVFYDGTVACARSLPAWVGVTAVTEYSDRPHVVTVFIPSIDRSVSLKPETWIVRTGTSSVRRMSKRAFEQSFTPLSEKPASLQERVVTFVRSLFGEAHTRFSDNWMPRFFSDATALVRAAGIDESYATGIVRRVYADREKSNVQQELGRTATTLFVASQATGHDLLRCAENELASVRTESGFNDRLDEVSAENAATVPVPVDDTVILTGHGYPTVRCILCGRAGWGSYTADAKSKPNRPASYRALGLEHGAYLDGTSYLVHAPGCATGEHVARMRSRRAD